MRRKLVIGNWKMHGRQDDNVRLVNAIRESVAGLGDVAMMVAPPALYLHQLAALLAGSGIRLAAQNLAEAAEGAFTGEIAAAMLVDVGAEAVIVGHSERRSLYGETDAVVVRKVGQALLAGLTPVVCVGETLAERDAGDTLQVVRQQLQAVIAGVGIEGLARSVVAYEPVWAIGTGRTASPAQAQEVHEALRALVAECDGVVAASLPVLYGGSVKAGNAADLFAMPDIDGALVGGASLVAQEFVAICKAAALAGR